MPLSSADAPGTNDPPEPPGTVQGSEGAWRVARNGCLGLTVVAGLAFLVLWWMGRHAVRTDARGRLGGGGSVCERARKCCIKTIQKRAGIRGAAGEKKARHACRAYAEPGLPDESCELGLETFEKSAKSLGLSCE